MGGSMAAGGLVATVALPVLADNLEVFPKRGRWERLSIAAHHIHAGASSPFSVLHISDTHLTAAYAHESEWTRKFMHRRTRTFGGRQEEALRDSLSWAKQHVDYVVHTGDLIDGQSEAVFDLVRKHFGEAQSSLIGCVGNHEYYHGQKVQNEETKGETRKLVAAAFPFDISLSSNVVNGVNFVSMDNSYGSITETQMGRLESEFKKGLPVVICVHCPFTTAGILRASRKFWSSGNLKAVPDVSNRKEVEPKADATHKEYIAWLKAQPLLKAILAGHLHITVSERFSPTAMQYCVGGNFLFHGQEITFS